MPPGQRFRAGPADFQPVFARQNAMMIKLRSLLKSRDGATAIEYGLIAALIGVVIIASVTALGTSIKDKFTVISGAIAAAN